MSRLGELLQLAADKGLTQRAVDIFDGLLFVRRLNAGERLSVMEGHPGEAATMADTQKWMAGFVAKTLCDKDGNAYCDSADEALQLPGDLFDSVFSDAMDFNGMSRESQDEMGKA